MAQAPLVTVGAPTDVVVPASLVGVSVETWLLVAMTRAAPCDENAFFGALARLGSAGVRVGGNSQDFTTVRRSRPRFTMGEAYFAGLRCAADRLGGPVDVGLNLRFGDAADTGAMMRRAAAEVPRERLSFSLGNEPDLMSRFGAGAERYARFLRAYRAMRARLPTSIGPFRGPDYSTRRFTGRIAPFVRDVRPSTLNLHAYPLSRCRRVAGDPAYPTVAGLASTGAAGGVIAALAPVIAVRRAGTPVAITELNSVACSGLAGVSDHPVSAMWGADIIAAAAQAGVSEMRFHLSTGAYDPLVLGPDGHLTARPLFNGMVFAAEHLRPGASMATLEGALPAEVSGWATAEPGATTVLLANHTTTPQVVRVGVPAGSGVRADALLPGNTDPQGAVSAPVVPDTADGTATVELPPYGMVAVVTAPA